MTLSFPVDDSSRVAEVRRAAERLAAQVDLDPGQGADISLVATEICTNLLKHAQQGEVFLSTYSDMPEPAFEILAVDRGPGISDVTNCLADGYSTANTSGNGLGAIARHSSDFDIYSQLGKGTVLVARIQRRNAVGARIGAVLKPIRGEEVSGDSWAFHSADECLTVIVADGLGHGMLAADASAEAVAAFRRARDHSPLAVLESVHASTRKTRGAAVAVAAVDIPNSRVRYAGIGNISGSLVGTGKPVLMISHNGTAGYHSPRLQEFTYTLPDPALLIMHSDGLNTSWNLDDYPGLRRRHPSVIAGVMYRDAARQRDDICVVVAKPREVA